LLDCRVERSLGREFFAMPCLCARLRTVLFALGSSGLVAACGLALLTQAGCEKISSSDAPLPMAASAAADKEVTDDELLKKIDDALDFTYDKRRLDLNQQAAWQIIHGALAFQRQFLVRDGDHDVSAIDHVLAGGKMKGWNLRRGDLLDESTQRYGIKSLLEQGTKTGQGHTDQWLGYLSDCQLPLETPIVVEGETQKIADWVAQIERDVYQEPIREYSWTLMVMTAYHPTDYQWTAGDGSQWSIDKLVEIELEHDLADSPCGGTHRMVGLTMARNRHLAAGGKSVGVWKECEDRIQQCIAKAHELQNPDGSLSSNYLQRPGNAPDLALEMGSAGHVLEFLTVSMDKDELQQAWVKRAVNSVCETFRKTKPVDVECGALFHAAHGLLLYREKMYGPRTFPKATADKTASTAK
jgi:hypothetical protein